MLIENVDYFVRVVQFPNAANRGAVYVNDDGTFDIYLNSRYPDMVKGYEHEVRHLLLEHFEKNKPVAVIEKEADGAIPNLFVGNAPGHIPCFNSLEAFRNYIIPFYIQENPALEKVLKQKII